MQKEKLVKIIKYIASVLIAVLLLYFSFRGVKWEDFTEGLASCRWELIAASMAAGIVAFGLRALRWRQILLPLDDSIGRLTVFNAVNIGYIANFVFPRIGEFVRCGVITGHSVHEKGGSAGSGGKLSRKKASYENVLGTVVLERSWDMVTMMSFFLLFIIIGWKRFGDFVMTRMWEPFTERFSGSVWLWISAGVLIVAVMIFIIVRFRSRAAVFDKISRMAEGLCKGFASCMKMEDKWKFFLYTLLIWVMYWLMSFFTMNAIPSLHYLTVADSVFLMLVGSLGWVVPVPGGFGAFHYIVSMALLAVYGIPVETGVVFATLSHESQAVTMILCGGLSYLSEAGRINSVTDGNPDRNEE